VISTELKRRSFKKLLERWCYDVWFTGTFGRRRYEQSGLREFTRFFKDLNTPYHTYFKGYVRCWVFVERKPWNDRVHIHALIQRIDPALAYELAQKWEELFGDAHVVPYDYTLKRQATRYIAEKYAHDWIRDYNFLKINSKYRKGSSLEGLQLRRPNQRR